MLVLPITNPVLLFAVILLIILIVPLILDNLNIPGIIGLIICGIIIGPYGFNIVENNSAIELFSTIGLLYLMFLIGLELDLNEFQLNKYQSIIFGFLTFTIPLAIGFPIFYHIFKYSFDASLLLSSTFATHTLVTYSIVSKRNIKKDKSIAITVGATILADIAVLTLLAVIINKAQHGISPNFWINLALSMTVFLAGSFTIIPILSKWFFRKFEGERHSHYIYVLAILFLTSWFAEVLGMEAIIGAFIAGIALNKLIPKSSTLMNKLEFVGNALFIPFFLVSVGMLVDIKVIFQDYMIVLLAVMFTVVSTFGKWLAALVSQLLFKFNRNQRELMTGLSSAHTAGTLAIILAGQKVGLVDGNILNATIIFMLLSCILSSLITQSASKKIALTIDSDKNDDATVPVIPAEKFLLPFVNMDTLSKQIKFTSYINDKKSKKTVSVLRVVPNDEKAEKEIYTIKRDSNDIKSIGSDSELDVKEIYTIDNNVVSALARTSREISASSIIIPWSATHSFSNLREERIRHIISSVDKSVYVCHLERSLIEQKRIVLFAPPLCHLETGFKLWVNSIIRLSQELSIPIVIYSDSKSYEAFIQTTNNGKKINYISHIEYEDWGNYHLLEQQINNNDIIVIVMSRKDYLSSNSYFDNLPFKLEKTFDEHIKIAIYPYQTSNE